MQSVSLLQYLIGISDMALYQAMWIFAIMGIALRLGLAIKNRDADIIETPDKLSWTFWFRDNSKRIATSLIITFIFLRFPNYLLQNIPSVADNVELRLITAFGIGFLGDKLATILRKWNFLGLNNSPIREKIKQQNEENPPLPPPPSPSDN